MRESLAGTRVHCRMGRLQLRNWTFFPKREGAEVYKLGPSECMGLRSEFVAIEIILSAASFCLVDFRSPNVGYVLCVRR